MRRRSFSWPQLWHALVPWLSIGWLVALVCVPITLFIWLFFFTNTFLVQAVTVLDARPHTTERMKEIATTYLESTLLNANIFFVQPEVLEEQLMSELATLRTVHVSRTLPGTLKIVAQEKTPVLLLLSHGNYYLVDTQGVAYEEAELDTLPGTALPIVRNSATAGEVTIGSAVVSGDFVQFVTTVESAVPAVTGATVVEIRIPSLAAREVHFLLSNNWTLRFDVTRSTESQIAIVRELLQHTITEEEQQTLDYIDLRIPNRVYYKTQE